jgi:hypothetical protein
MAQYYPEELGCMALDHHDDLDEFLDLVMGKSRSASVIDSSSLLETPIPEQWEHLRHSVSRRAGRSAVIAGGAIRDHILGVPVKDLDIFVMGLSDDAAREIFGAIRMYVGYVDNSAGARTQYVSESGIAVDLVFLHLDHPKQVLDRFDLGICRVCWDGTTILATEDFHRDLTERTISQFYPSPSGHADRVMAKLGPLGFRWNEHVRPQPINGGRRDLRSIDLPSILINPIPMDMPGVDREALRQEVASPRVAEALARVRGRN